MEIQAENSFYDVIVIGAGPAGAEAALAAARLGAQTLCLAISLDSPGLPPGSPVLINNGSDPQSFLLEEIEHVACRLCGIVKQKDVCLEGDLDRAGRYQRLIVDRRNLSLAYKELLEETGCLNMRQALAVSVEPVRDIRFEGNRPSSRDEAKVDKAAGEAAKNALRPCRQANGRSRGHQAKDFKASAEPAKDMPGRPISSRNGGGTRFGNANAELVKEIWSPGNSGSGRDAVWKVRGNLGEEFFCRSLVVSAGTFLNGVVCDGGFMQAGGRRGEIPANSLALSLEKLGLQMIEIEAGTGARLDLRGVLERGQAAPSKTNVKALDGLLATKIDPVPDGNQLGESWAPNTQSEANRLNQILSLRQHAGAATAWVTRTSYSVRHLAVKHGQLGPDLQALKQPGLFLAGRAAGCDSFIEAAATGCISGMGAAAAAGRGKAAPRLRNDMKFVTKLCQAIANERGRPVSIRSSIRSRFDEDSETK